MIGDGPLNILETFEAAAVWKMTHDIPEAVCAALIAEYVEAIGRAPTESEIESLLKLNAGDASLGVPAQVLKFRNAEPT